MFFLLGHSIASPRVTCSKTGSFIFVQVLNRAPDLKVTIEIGPLSNIRFGLPTLVTLAVLLAQRQHLGRRNMWALIYISIPCESFLFGVFKCKNNICFGKDLGTLDVMNHH